MTRFQKLVFFLALTVPAAAAAETLVYLGTYTRGESKGIYRSTLDEATGELSNPVLAAELAARAAAERKAEAGGLLDAIGYR